VKPSSKLSQWRLVILPQQYSYSLVLSAQKYLARYHMPLVPPPSKFLISNVTSFCFQTLVLMVELASEVLRLAQPGGPTHSLSALFPSFIWRWKQNPGSEILYFYNLITPMIEKVRNNNFTYYHKQLSEIFELQLSYRFISMVQDKQTFIPFNYKHYWHCLVCAHILL
jgi:hypothetical protein